MYDEIDHVANYDFMLRSLRDYEKEVSKLRELNAKLTEELHAARALAESAFGATVDPAPLEPVPDGGYYYEA